jgi:hypothetical protein
VKSREKLGQDSRFSGQDSNRGPPEYEAEYLITMLYRDLIHIAVSEVWIIGRINEIKTETFIQ